MYNINNIICIKKEIETFQRFQSGERERWREIFKN
jgi:hypothetical protein